MTQPAISRVLAPVVTPFDQQLEVDVNRLISHCQWLIDNNVGLAVFGTNSEANSMSANEKVDVLNRLHDAGLPPSQMMPGTGCCSIDDTVLLTRTSVSLGCTGVLMLPPFYYKNVSDEGLFRHFSEVVERVADDRLRVYLYHIPPIAQVGISLDLIDRLLDAYPKTFAGIKDSSGDWNNTEAMLKRFASRGFEIFSGAETFLLDNCRGGGAGCISATANVHPGPIATLAENWQSDDAVQQQQRLNDIRSAFEGYVMIPSLKAAIAAYSDDDEWIRVRPPLVELDESQRQHLVTTLVERSFEMPGLI
ncbi:MAG: dihydrodipicolinate synthase family protein [marine bacterium B5-7]|nr:MAG: dihydrodipicolinate synthase family protein [marine bacterium B5-7]